MGGQGPVSLVLDIGESGDFVHPEALVYVDGVRIAACDRYHAEIVLPEGIADGAEHDLLLHGWTSNGASEHGRGEALARQFLLGRSFFKDMFGEGADTPILWLPDVFGYAWSLPQLIKLAGLEYFFTIKIGWNQYNRLPFEIFRDELDANVDLHGLIRS